MRPSNYFTKMEPAAAPAGILEGKVPGGAADDALSGYLLKKARNETWQRRWFETQGFYLVYYKNRKMEKLLAALSLPQVGEIRLIPQSEDVENKPGLFALELNGRIYMLRANSNVEAEMWVRTMLKLREQGQGVQNGTASVQNEGEVAETDATAGTEIDTETPGKAPRSPLATPATASWVKKEKQKSSSGCCPPCF